jgi:prepilin-type N-terminal cleavage/methylation domain-containing protein
MIARRGLSLIEVIVAIVMLGVVMTFVGHVSASIAAANKSNNLIAKRTFAMQQQANLIGALPYASLNSSVVPASKTFTLGDFTYLRRVTMTQSGSVSTGYAMTITITIVPQTGIPSDTLKQETVTMVRSNPSCGTALLVASC